MIEGHRVILRKTDQSHSSKGIDAMTTAHNIDLPAVFAERRTSTHPMYCASCWARSSAPAQRPTRCAAPGTATFRLSGRTPVTGIGTANSAPVQAHWI